MHGQVTQDRPPSCPPVRQQVESPTSIRYQVGKDILIAYQMPTKSNNQPPPIHRDVPVPPSLVKMLSKTGTKQTIKDPVRGYRITSKDMSVAVVVDK